MDLQILSMSTPLLPKRVNLSLPPCHRRPRRPLPLVDARPPAVALSALLSRPNTDRFRSGIEGPAWVLTHSPRRFEGEGRGGDMTTSEMLSPAPEQTTQRTDPSSKGFFVRREGVRVPLLALPCCCCLRVRASGWQS